MDSDPLASNPPTPEVLPGADRGEDEIENSTVVLPTARTPVGSMNRAAMAKSGLRIGVDAARETPTHSSRRIEVNELNRAAVRLESTIPAPPKVVGKIAVREDDLTLPNAGAAPWWSGWVRIRWIAATGAAIVAMVILTMALLPIINAPNAPRADSKGRSLQVVNEEKIEGLDAMNRLLAKQPEAMRIFRLYAQAVRVDEILPLLWDGEAIKETLRDRWRPLRVPSHWTPPADCTWTVFEATGHLDGLLQGNFPDHSGFEAYFIDDGNRMLLDWKATTAYGTASFAQLAKNEGDGSEIRGKITVADFYSATWSESEYQCYLFTSPDDRIGIWCYARRGEAAANTISELLKVGEITQEAEASRSMTLGLERGASGGQPNQWLIKAILQIDSASP